APAAMESRHHRLHGYPCRRIQPAHRLIQYVQVLRLQEAGSQAQFLRHALRELAHGSLKGLRVKFEFGSERYRIRVDKGNARELERHGEKFAAEQVIGWHEAFGEIGEARTRDRLPA